MIMSMNISQTVDHHCEHLWLRVSRKHKHGQAYQRLYSLKQATTYYYSFFIKFLTHPTDMMYFASGSMDLPGAVFTASHNPTEYNGIKMCRRGAGPLGAETGLDAIKEMSQSLLDPEAETGSSQSLDLLDDFAQHVLSFIEPHLR